MIDSFNENEKEKGFSFLEMMKYWQILKKHILLILGITVITLGITAFYTYAVMKPMYTSSTQLLVNQKLDKSQLAIQAQQAQTDVQRIYTYKDIISSPVIQDTVKHDLKNEPGVGKAKIGVQNQQNSQVFTVDVTASNPYTAANIANDTAKVFQNKVKKMMSINSVTVVSKAQPELKPTSPSYVLNLIGGLIFGMILGILISILIEANNRTVRDNSFLEDTLGLNNLGFVTEISDKDMKKNLISKKGNGHTRNRRV